VSRVVAAAQAGREAQEPRYCPPRSAASGLLAGRPGCRRAGHGPGFLRAGHVPLMSMGPGTALDSEPGPSSAIRGRELITGPAERRNGGRASEGGAARWCRPRCVACSPSVSSPGHPVPGGAGRRPRCRRPPNPEASAYQRGRGLETSGRPCRPRAAADRARATRPQCSCGLERRSGRARRGPCRCSWQPQPQPDRR